MDTLIDGGFASSNFKGQFVSSETFRDENFRNYRRFEALHLKVVEIMQSFIVRCLWDTSGLWWKLFWIFKIR